MARPREFDEGVVLDAAVQCFWKQGYEGTSVRDLVTHTGITAASLYNAFGDKRTLYQKALDHYVEESVADRIRRCEALPPLRAIEEFFDEIVKRSLNDRDRKGCMLVNAARDVAPHDPAFREAVAEVLVAIEAFSWHVSATARPTALLRGCCRRTPWRGIVSACRWVFASLRLCPERALLDAVVAPALAVLSPGPGATGA
jgi:TetR/AcrR family transcriptional repressor of nem operon